MVLDKFHKMLKKVFNKPLEQTLRLAQQKKRNDNINQICSNFSHMLDSVCTQYGSSHSSAVLPILVQQHLLTMTSH